MQRLIPNWDRLQGSISGTVVLPESPDYDSARKPAIARYHDVRPQAVVFCESAEDVAATLLFARRSGVPTTPRSGGHCFAGRSSTFGVVVDVSRMRSVSVANGAATVGAGARLAEVYDALDGHGLTLPAGCGPTVGIAGLTLGGGFGVLGRTHGLTADRLRAAQVVLADGRIVACDAQHHADLFWALRGAGGGNVGVVTTLVFEPIPAPTATAFHLAWPHAAAVAVVAAWQDWAPAAPDGLAASLLLAVPGDPDRPPVVNLFGLAIGDEPGPATLLGDLVARAGADPTSATRERLPFREAKRYLAALGDAMTGDDRHWTTRENEPVPSRHAFSKSEFFRRSLPAEVVAALVRNLGENRIPGQARDLDFTPWGGAYNRSATGATAFAHRAERFLLQHTVTHDADALAAEAAAARRWLERSWASVRPWGAGGVYPNFPDPDLPGWARAYHGANLDRLTRVKQKYDPDGCFRFHQSIPRRARGVAAAA